MQTKPISHPVLWNLIFGLLLLAGLVTLLMSAPSSGAVAFAAAGDHPGDPAEASGAIEVLQVSDDLVGVWIVAGVDYNVTAETRLGPDLTVFVVGECVEVKYDAQTDPFTAHKIEHDADCEGDGGGDHPGDPAEASGAIEVLQVGDNLVGVWTVDGVDYEVTAETRLGPDLTVFVVGECVEVKYDAQTAPFSAHKIEHDADCDGEGDGDDDDDGGHHGDDAEFKGPIEFLPETDGLIGIWTVRGVEFDVTADTELEAEYGPFATGVCVEIDYDDSTMPYTAIKIEGEREYACRGGDDGGDHGHDGEGELYGVLQAFPAELIGEWQIGGWTFLADAGTEFDQERGAFEIDGLVKVEFYVTSDGVNHAKEIKAKDDRGDDHHNGHDGNAFGPIESLPAELVGDWVIGGLTYRANSETRFEQEHGEFAVDVWVKVRYYVDESGDRIAVKIETEDDHAGGQAPDLSKFVGFVDSMPETGGFVGNWVVAGETFVAGPQTRFEEEHVALAVGAYVELEYRLVDGVNKVHEMQTEVPPDAGDDNAVGEIESMGDGAAAAGLDATSTWRIGGQAYTITDATRLNDDQSALAVGATALVNSYTAADGSQVATSVTGVEINYRVFLPVTSSQ